MIPTKVAMCERGTEGRVVEGMENPSPSPSAGTRFRVQVQRNGGPRQGGRVVMVTEGQDFAQVLDAVAAKMGGTLDRPTLRLFTAEGGEVEATDELCPDDFLYVAHRGEAFGRPGQAVAETRAPGPDTR